MMEWLLGTPRLKQFKVKVVGTRTSYRTDLGVDEDGNPTTITIKEEETYESETEVEAPANRVRLSAAFNDTSAFLFHIRLIYGRLGADGQFESTIRDDGIVIGGPDYFNLDTNEDGLISEDELLAMSAKILGWDGELKWELPVEELA